MMKWSRVDGAVALDAALGVEQEVVVAFTGGECGDVVGDHAVEPAGGVRAGDAQEGPVGDWGEGRAMQDGVELCGFGHVVLELPSPWFLAQEPQNIGLSGGTSCTGAMYTGSILQLWGSSY